ncbi:hypothetical protein MKW94_028693, partial [Papaver nudicaule]|nr:hypothetical protein [Papaver nudicaule]
MGATTSTLENDIESVAGKMFENNLYTEGSLSTLPEKSTETRWNQAPAEVYLTVIDSPDHHIQQTNNDCSYDIEYVKSSSSEEVNLSIHDYNYGKLSVHFL